MKEKQRGVPLHPSNKCCCITHLWPRCHGAIYQSTIPELNRVAQVETATECEVFGKETEGSAGQSVVSSTASRNVNHASCLAGMGVHVSFLIAAACHFGSSVTQNGRQLLILPTHPPCSDSASGGVTQSLWGCARRCDSFRGVEPGGSIQWGCFKPLGVSGEGEAERGVSNR